MDDDVEFIARAFYALQDEVRGWDREPEPLKETFRRDARTAITMVDAEAEARHQANGGALIVHRS
jgi:hypothetical protein